jgi:hypothetical protein
MAAIIQMGVTAGIFLASILLKEMRYLVYIRYLCPDLLESQAAHSLNGPYILNIYTEYLTVIIRALQSVCKQLKQSLCLHFCIQNIELYSTTIYIFKLLEYNK